ncbi:hypothetical protein [Gardnerella greenwoodii]|uniref:Peptidase n=1 Tax=Gardnerella greenwoodii TaxID=2914925 RepID=A0A2N6RYN5_9BIFI|nr:hypothetical protein [Gardnerella greenwoodii]MDF0753502.1 hypothetical protein [Gardnerella greenwoodii]PMC43219.1 hypothetical protein CJ216_03870 [Gardnerella greenwoodii]
MLNKKAIAALAAGATLLSGMAFAAPAFAAETPKCTPVAAEKLAELKQAVTEAKRNVAKAERKLAEEKDNYAEGTEAYNAAKGLVDAFKQAVKNYKDAKKAADEAKADADNKGALTDAAKKAAKAVNAAAAAVKKVKKFENVAYTPIKEDATVDAPADTTFDQTLGEAPDKHEIHEAEVDLSDANGALQDAKDALAKGECKDAPSEDPDHKNDQDPTPTPQGKDVQHTLIDKVRFAKMMLDDADDALAHAKATLKDKTAALAAATAELKARVNDLDNAKLRLNEFLASGVNDSATQTRLSDAVARAEAHVTRATAAFAKATAEYKDALTKAFAAVDAYNKALADYKAIYNEAVANGVNPALLPPVVTSDPLSKNFPQVPGAKALYDEALSGKFGQEVKKILEETSSKKNDAKKADAKKSAAPLAKTGAAVALAAVAASVLAGMGAALRKIRH